MKSSRNMAKNMISFLLLTLLPLLTHGAESVALTVAKTFTPAVTGTTEERHFPSSGFTAPRSPLRLRLQTFIVSCLFPEGKDPRAFDIEILTKVTGSEAEAKKALVFTYKNFNGFAAKLTFYEASLLKKVPGVLDVKLSETYPVDPPPTGGW